MMMLIFDNEEYPVAPKVSGMPGGHPRGIPREIIQYAHYVIQVNKKHNSYNVLKNRMSGQTGQFAYNNENGSLEDYINDLLTTEFQIRHYEAGMQAPHPEDISD